MILTQNIRILLANSFINNFNLLNMEVVQFKEEDLNPTFNYGLFEPKLLYHDLDMVSFVGKTE